MNSLIENKVKTNMCLDSIKLFIGRTNLCATVQTYATYLTIITTQTIHSLFLSAYNLFASHTCILFCTQPGCSNTQLHTRLIELH